MERLIEQGHAYAATDGSGDVYFDVRSWPALRRADPPALDDMEAAEDADPRGKRDPRDFALWKGAQARASPRPRPGPSPVGRGPPGLAHRVLGDGAQYLGDEFDIHGGGLDLRFPHHENELAQSHGRRATASRATGCTTAW